MVRLCALAQSGILEGRGGERALRWDGLWVLSSGELNLQIKLHSHLEILTVKSPQLQVLLR